jgi:hypothetical protein
MKWRSCLWVGLAVSALFGLVAVGATITVNPGESIQAAISAAGAGDTILIMNGTYDESFQVPAGKDDLTIQGESRAGVVIKPSGTKNCNSAGIYVNNGVSGLALSNLTFDGSTASSKRYGIKFGTTTDCELSNVTAQNCNRTGVDLLGSGSMTVTQVASLNNTGGHGMQLSDCNNVTLSGITVSGNGWQGVSVCTWGRYTPLGTSGIVVTGVNTFSDVFQIEEGDYSHPGVAPSGNAIVTYSTDLATGADVTFLGGDFACVLHGDQDDSPGQDRVWFAKTFVDAATVAAMPGAVGHLLASGRFIEDLANPTQLYATEGCEIQAAVEAGADGYAVHVAAETFTEQVVLTQDEQLVGEGSGTVIQSPATLGSYFVSSGTTKNYPIIFVHDTDNVLIRDLVVDGLGRGNANYRFIGIGLYNAGGVIDGVEVTGIRNTPFSGSQHGVGIYAYNADGVARTLEISDSSVSEFQKNGMALLGAGLTVNVHGNNVVVGEGQTAVIAQNGIQVGSGAGGTISGNTVTSVWYTGTYWGSTGILIIGAAPGIEILGNYVVDCQMAINSDTAGTVVANNDVQDSQWGVILYEGAGQILGNDLVDDSYSIYSKGSNTVIERNVITGSDWSMLLYGTGNQVHYNSITGSTSGLYAPAGADAILNWWGDVSGPSGDGTGTGDSVWGNVIFSPWLGTDPDGSPALAGVQITGPMLIVVDDVGPAPAGGYLNAAIAGSNSATLGYEDTIQLLDGSFTASTPVTDGVTLVSQNGAGGAAISGSLLLNSANVILGRMREGFALSGPVTVGAGVDASTIHINWNDIYDVVTNGGGGWLDATFNYWGEDGPDTVGLVSVYPYLPVAVDTLIGYVDGYGYSVSDAIAFATLLVDGATLSEAELIVLLANEFGVSTEEAAALIGDYGSAAVYRATVRASSLEELMLNLVGYEASIPSGGAGGGAGGDLGGYVVGSVVPLFLVLADPFTGDPVVDALVTYTVARTLEDGTFAFERFGVMPYDAAAAGYALALDTTGLIPGSHVVYLGTDDGRSVSYTIVLTE